MCQTFSCRLLCPAGTHHVASPVSQSLRLLSDDSLGPKISQNVNYTQRGTDYYNRDDGGAEGPERGTEARTAGVTRGLGSGEGRRRPSPVWGSGAYCPQKMLKFNSANLFIFFNDFKTEIALPSVVFHSFTAHICSSSIILLYLDKRSK